MPLACAVCQQRLTSAQLPATVRIPLVDGVPARFHATCWRQWWAAQRVDGDGSAPLEQLGRTPRTAAGAASVCRRRGVRTPGGNARHG